MVVDTAPQWLLIDLQHWYDTPVLLAVTGGAHARRMAALPAERRVEQVTALVNGLARRGAPRPRQTAVSDWHNDPYTGGCYSRFDPTIGKVRTERAIEALGEPVGRVLFAGEATSVAAPSTIDGAWLSGIREAKRLLQTASVAIL